MVITLEMVKELREKSGAGMSDCKKALVESSGDIEAASDLLRKKGLISAAKRVNQVAAEGAIILKTSENKAVILELNSQTDFVAKNDKFHALAQNLALLALHNDINSKDDFLELEYLQGKVKDYIAEYAAMMGENIVLRRLQLLTAQNGIIAHYTHNIIADSLGKIGVLISIESDGPSSELYAFGKKIGMHIAALNPICLNVSDLAPELVQKERDFIIEQAKASNYPDNVMEKIVNGRMSKYYEEVVLLEQSYALDSKVKISKMISDFEMQNKCNFKISSFTRFALGEGIEKQDSNFASEVASMIK